MSDSPAWLSDFCEAVLSAVCPLSPMPPWGCHIFWNEEWTQWEITLFASSTEVQGGANDGRQLPFNFHVDLTMLQQIFPTINEFHWQALSHPDDDDLGPHVAIDGIYQGEQVWLRLPATAPACFEAGRSLNVNQMQLENLW
ncbi:hypothetical protein Pla110_38350 [Polystyrenella longa]|uniref:Uncharacterized protein n=1 Tax=Polystyrenella longa TaxID=2528007 RepID=A0A518CS89_9PLAN|nr:hypothetical protein [Polystyrenella longa]QDU82080.1 hypothetical protein Pla110_38350 [Polystyrenella longa]